MNNELINSHDFIISVVDTDSVAFVKPDMSPFTEEEQYSLIAEINSYFPSNIKYAHDGYFEKCIVLKAKNYIMYDGKKIKLKGSGVKDQKKEPILRKMLDDMIYDLVHTNGYKLKSIYEQYIKLALNPTDIKQWCQKKTVTKAVLNCQTDEDARKNERDVWVAIKDLEMQEGDKTYVYPCVLAQEELVTTLKNGKTRTKITKTTGLKCAEHYANDCDIEKLVERVYATVQILANVVPEGTFLDYTLVKNKYLLDILKLS